MIPFDSDKDIRKWTSKFHGAIMDVEIGKNIVCQKYSKLREKCPHFAIAVLVKEEYGNEDVDIISKYQKKKLNWHMN